MLISGSQGVKESDELRVQLIITEVERGFIDFKKIG
jgi:hypothetical protein